MTTLNLLNMTPKQVIRHYQAFQIISTGQDYVSMILSKLCLYSHHGNKLHHETNTPFRLFNEC